MRTMLRPSWTALLEGRQAARARQTAYAIGDYLLTHNPKDEKPPKETATPDSFALRYSLGRGYAGEAVLFAHLAGHDRGGRYAEGAVQRLEATAEALASAYFPPTFLDGFAGVAWAFEHVRQLLGIQRSVLDLDDLDAHLAGYVARTPWTGPYDLVWGLVGLGVYALSRWPRPNAELILVRVTNRLEELAETPGADLTWHTPPELLPAHQRETCPQGHYNLGVAHGMPAVCAFLAALATQRGANAREKLLADRAVAWLLAQQGPYDRGARFPNWTGPGTTPSASRLAWCYGDLGIAGVLYPVRVALGDDITAELRRIARGAARRHEKDSYVVDACLCHGAAGVGHLFNRLYQATDDVELAAAARRWLGHVYALRGGRAADWVDDRSLLSGATGVALCLWSASTAEEPSWDRLLMLSTDRGGQQHEGT